MKVQRNQPYKSPAGLEHLKRYVIFRTFCVKLKKELIEGVTQNKEVSHSNVSNGHF